MIEKKMVDFVFTIIYFHSMKTMNLINNLLISIVITSGIISLSSGSAGL